MNKITFYDYDNLNLDDKFKYFMSTLSLTNRTPEYYVNFEKVVARGAKYKDELLELDKLLDSEDIISDARTMFLKNPDLLKAIPSLIACTVKNLDILLVDEDDGDIDIVNLDFNNPDINRIDEYIDFIADTGLFDFLKNNIYGSLIDYVYGVAAGLDTNARKNRSGSTMENILSKSINSTCERIMAEHKSQATRRDIKKAWGIDVPVDKASRRFDEALYDPVSKKLYLIETNYYGSSGSKLKAVSGEFITLNRLINLDENNIYFIWVTDGQGWFSAQKPLEEAFEEIRYIFNIKMLSNSYIDDLLLSKRKN